MRYIQRILLLLVLGTPLLAFGQKTGHSIHLTVKDKDSKEPIIMATVQLQPSGTIAVTNADGQATFQNIENGNYTLQVSYGYHRSQAGVPDSCQRSPQGGSWWYCTDSQQCC